MATISVPLTPALEHYIKMEVKMGNSDNKAQVVRKALQAASREAAYQRILQAQREPNLYGDIRELMKQID